MLIEFGAGQAEFLGDHLGGSALVESHIVVALHHRRSHGLAVTPLGSGGAHGDPGHGLDATGDGDVVVTRDHAGRCLMHSLLRGPALTIDGQAGNALRPTGGQYGQASHTRCLLPDLGDAAPDDVVDEGRVQPGAGGQRIQHLAREIHRVDACQAAVALADRASYRVDDYCITHLILLHEGMDPIISGPCGWRRRGG